MFKKNIIKKDKQQELPFFVQYRVEDFFETVKGTEEDFFYQCIYCNIDEDIFRDLYCEDNGRPNAPINSMISALILREKRNWSYKDLLHEMRFNIAVRWAIGMKEFDDLPFNEATLFNFQNRIKNYLEESGINLLEKIFDSMTETQLKTLKIKTNVARTDSIMINSNIRKYSRLQLLIEIVLRLYKVMGEAKQEEFNELFAKYSKTTSEKYIYEIKGSDFSMEFDSISRVYYWLSKNVPDNCKDTKEYNNFLRVLREQFSQEEEQIQLKAPSDISTSSLQSPDDAEATYRKKKGEKYYGYSATVTETADPENVINLITDVAVEANNVDDSRIIEKRVEVICEKQSDLEEIHFDGGFGSNEVSDKFSANGVTAYQTAIRGRKAEVEMNIDKTEAGYKVTCAHSQTRTAEKTKKRYRVEFDMEICKSCPLVNDCPTKVQSKGEKRVYYFDDADYKKYQRYKAIETLPKDRRKIRNNVEATMKEYSCRLNGHKLKVRSQFKASVFAFMTSMAINFGRIFRFFFFSLFFTIICQIFVKIKSSFTDSDENHIFPEFLNSFKKYSLKNTIFLKMGF